jgi:hypothetical protein
VRKSLAQRCHTRADGRRALLRPAGVRFKVSANPETPQCLKLRSSLSQLPKDKQN